MSYDHRGRARIAGHRRRACVALRGGVGADACNVVQRCVGGALLGKATDCVSFYRGVCATDAGSTCRAQNMALVASCRRRFDCQQRHVPVSSPFMVMVAYPAANIGQYLASEFTVTWLVFWHCFPASLPDICVACCSMAHVRVARWREALRGLVIHRMQAYRVQLGITRRSKRASCPMPPMLSRACARFYNAC